MQRDNDVGQLMSSGRLDPSYNEQPEEAAPNRPLSSAFDRHVPASPNRARTALIGGLILLLGLGVSIVVAAKWRSSALETNRRSFQSTAADLSSTLAARISADIQLTRTMRAHAAMETQESETRYQQWYLELQRGAPSSPDVVAAFIRVVPAAELRAFRRHSEADPAFRRLLGTDLQILPPGTRSRYCLTSTIVGKSAVPSTYRGLVDYCAPFAATARSSPYPALVRTATDTASFIVTPLRETGSRSLVAIAAAVYRRGASIATVSARRSALRGFIATTFDSTTTIRSVLTGRSGLDLALYHRNAGGPLDLIGSAGAHPGGRSGGYASRRELGEGWVLETTGTANAFASPDLGVVALGLGLLVTILMFLLHLVLSNSRQRAWALVGERTGELEYLALHDPLTDLPNRILVLDRAEQILARARRNDVPVTALFVDIDGFKQINDRHGHQAGDEVLRHVGARLNAILRDSDTVGRLSGDEFVMLVDTLGLEASPELVAERILDVLRQPIELTQGGSIVSLTASIGIATGRPASAEALMENADVALYRAKAIGKNGYVKFESAMQVAVRERIHLETDLAEALDAGQFFLVYQPMVELRSERIVGVEALLRWRHPVSGVVSPEVFIPIAEENGLIIPIGRWVLEQACAQSVAWKQRGYPLNISVNASARQLERPEFVEEVRCALVACDMDPASLTLEITETALMRDPDTTARLLTGLKTLGIRIAVDDFGTGYSSLAYLRQFPVDSLKIDRSFITGLALSSEAHALAHTLIQLGKALGLETLAEGVEHYIQVQELQREGCDLAQGFLFARPLHPNDLELMLRESGAASHAEALHPVAPA